MATNHELRQKINELFGTQKIFAKFIKTSPVIVSYVVRGHRNISREAKKRWAKALQCKVADIF